jgi:hypothetical protein
LPLRAKSLNSLNIAVPLFVGARVFRSLASRIASSS